MTDIIVPGALVEWESQAGGYWKRKVGVVIAYVPAGEDAVKALTDAGEDGRVMGQPVSLYDRYLVRVQTGKRAVRYYTPRATLVRRYDELRGGDGHDV